MYNSTLRPVSSLVSRVLSEKLLGAHHSSRVGLWHIYRAARVTAVSGCSSASTLPDPVCSTYRFSPMKSISDASALAGVHCFAVAGLRARQWTTAVASIDANSTNKMGEWYYCNQILVVSRIYSLNFTYNSKFYLLVLGSNTPLTQSRETRRRPNNIGLMCSKNTTSLVQRID
jgi:hypothetical protein